MVIQRPSWVCTDLSGPEQEGVAIEMDDVPLTVLLSPGDAMRLARSLQREAVRAHERMSRKGSRAFRALTYDAPL